MRSSVPCKSGAAFGGMAGGGGGVLDRLVEPHNAPRPLERQVEVSLTPRSLHSRVQARMMPGDAVRADAMAEPSLGAGAHVALDGNPLAIGIANVLAMHADGKEPAQRAHFAQRDLELPDDAFVLALQRLQRGDVGDMGEEATHGPIRDVGGVGRQAFAHGSIGTECCPLEYLHLSGERAADVGNALLVERTERVALRRAGNGRSRLAKPAVTGLVREQTDLLGAPVGAHCGYVIRDAKRHVGELGFRGSGNPWYVNHRTLFNRRVGGTAGSAAVRAPAAAMGRRGR